VTGYTPRPIDTSAVELPAESTHDVWAVTRLRQGWVYGPTRDDAGKRHPCLVPYADLPESEKEYDRQTAAETLKAIIALGYRIDRANESTPSGVVPA
jgi:hypothetical protein